MPAYCYSSSDFLQSHQTVLLSSFLLPCSCTSRCYCSLPCTSQILQVRIFSSSFLSFHHTSHEFLQWPRVYSSDDLCQVTVCVRGGNYWMRVCICIIHGERLDHCEIRKNGNYLRSFRKMPHRGTKHTESMDRILIWAVQYHKATGDPSILNRPQTDRARSPHPLQRSWGCRTITEEREVSWNWQHPSRTGQSEWKGRNYRSHDNLRQDLADRTMANPVDPVLGLHASLERQPAAVPELPNDQPHHPSKQSHCEDHTEKTETASGESHCWRTGRLLSRKEHQRADLQLKNPLWEISPAPTRVIPCLHRFQESFQQGFACSFVGNTSIIRQSS